MLRNEEKNRKYEIENSTLYMSYRLMYIMGSFLSCKKIPKG